jgi:hypothetical protein
VVAVSFVLYGGQRISTRKQVPVTIFDEKILVFFFSCTFSQFSVIKTLDPDPDWLSA